MAPIFFDYPRTPLGLKKVNIALSTFEAYLRATNSKYAAGDHLTIADFALVAGTIPLEGIEFDLKDYPLVQKWYATFKAENKDIWAIAEGGLKEIAHFEKNAPDLSAMNHPIHPVRNKK